MRISKKKSPVNRNTPKVHGRRAIAKNITKLKGIEHKKMKTRFGKKIKNYLLKLIYRFKERSVLSLPKQRKTRV